MYKMPNFFTIPFLVNFELLQQQLFALYRTTKGFSRFHYSLTAWMAEISLSEVSFFIMIPLQNCSNYQKCSILTTIAISAYFEPSYLQNEEFEGTCLGFTVFALSLTNSQLSMTFLKFPHFLITLSKNAQNAKWAYLLSTIAVLANFQPFLPNS